MVFDFCYRTNEITKQPNGKLEIELQEAWNVQYMRQSYNPVMEFCLGEQKILVNEKLNMMRGMNVDSNAKYWMNQKDLTLRTRDSMETLVIKFYNQE